MKKSNAVSEAQQFVATKRDELAAARLGVKQLEAEHSQAIADLRVAQIQADANLPQCRMTSRSWRGSNETDCGLVVILRKTPTGMLVARHVGEPSGATYKFKWSRYTGTFEEQRKNGMLYGTRLLRDVPQKYVPQTPAAAVQLSQNNAEHIDTQVIDSQAQ